MDKPHIRPIGDLWVVVQIPFRMMYYPSLADAKKDWWRVEYWLRYWSESKRADSLIEIIHGA